MVLAEGPVLVRVPATSANLGPGFDALGLALGLHDEIEVRVAGSGLSLEVSGESADDVGGAGERHLIVRAMRVAFDALGVAQPEGLALRCVNRIPHGRGLGSSAAAIVAGLLAARALAGASVAPGDVLPLASELEGHPDNVAPCLFGGLTIAWTVAAKVEAPWLSRLETAVAAGGPDTRAVPAIGPADSHNGGSSPRGITAARAVRLEPLPGVRPVVFVAPEPVSTKVARGLLPAAVPHGDAARNAGRAALLVAALTSSPGALLDATEDWLHQDYRAPAMPHSHELVTRLRAAGVPAVISGAGPSVLAFLAGNSARDEASWLDSIAAETGIEWRISPLAVERHGASVAPRVTSAR